MGHDHSEHLTTLHQMLFNEKARYTKDRNPLRKVWIDGIEREITSTRELMGLPEEEEILLSDDELLAELGM